MFGSSGLGGGERSIISGRMDYWEMTVTAKEN